MGLAEENFDEEAWLRDQRARVEVYLRRQNVDHLGVGEVPAFSVPPYVALWAVQSRKSTGWIGWWAISGDLPTDYISSSEGRHPREALRAFSKVWRNVSACMIRGESYPNYSIGRPEQGPDLGELLRRRAEILGEYAADDGLWEASPKE